MKPGPLRCPEGRAPDKGVDFDSREPCAFERIWGAVARPVGEGPFHGVELMTPLEALSLRRPLLEELFGGAGRADAAEARARVLLKERVERTADAGGC